MWFLTIQNAGEYRICRNFSFWHYLLISRLKLVFLAVFSGNLEEDISYYFIKKEITFVGRKDKDIMIQNDDSISRNHAKLILEDGKLFVQDEKSKYVSVFVFKNLIYIILPLF